MAANKRPDWLPDGMDADSSYYLDIRIVTPTSRDGWFELDKVVDADVTNFTDLIQGVVDKYPCGYGDIVRLFYFCMESKVNIQISSDQELVEMFAKHKDSKRCLLTLAYHSPSIAPIEIPPWNFSTTVTSVEPPITPSIACPSLAGPSQSTQNQTDKTESLLNPNPLNEHVGVDDEGLYIVLGPEHPPPLNYSQWQAESPGPDDASSESDESGESDESDEETIVEDMDEIIKDREPKQMPDVDYDQNDPPMSVGTVYSNMAAFKIALASHAVKHEFNYDIEKSEPGRYRVNCIFKSEGCPWRIHAATQKDDLTVKVVKNPWPHDCFSTRRLKDEICVGVTQFWVCNQVVDWLKEDGNIKCTELQRRLKGKHKILVPYRRVYKGKNLAMDQIYGPWGKSFDNLYRLKAQLEETSPGTILAIDHHTVNNKIRFKRLFFAMKPCVDGFLRGCRPYLAIDSTFLTGRFRGQLCVACAVDGHNWMYPVAVGIIESETNEDWEWFMERLKEAIGIPEGLTFCTDCGQAVMHGVSTVFPDAEHRECMWHLVQNFKKRYSGKIFDDHLWASAYSWSPYMFAKHYQAMAAAKPEAMKYLQQEHKKLWTRSQFRTLSKVDYVTNNLAESFNNWIKGEKGKRPDDLLDTIRQKILIKWNHRKRVAKKFEGKILPHIMQKLREDSYNLDIEVITSSPEGIAEICAKGGTGYRFVVNLPERTCTCRVWQGSGIPCKHAIAYITSISGAKLEDHVDDYFSVKKFRAAYEGSIPSIPDKTMWPKATHDFFMHPPLLKSTGGGRRKNRLKSAIEGGNQQKGKKHECPICHQLGHRWYTCKNGDPEDIAAMEAERGPPKKKQKKSASCSTETSIVVATPSVMVFPHNEAVANATHIKRKRKSSSTKGAMNSKGSATTTSSSAPSNRSGTGSNDPVPLQILQSVPSQEDTADGPAQMEPPQHVLPHASPRKKMAVKKKLTPKKFQIASACPASPASNTRSKKNLNM